ncbi:MAG: hypothetical protein AB2421_04255 [Thermotaleaceae bacterium]
MKQTQWMSISIIVQAVLLCASVLFLEAVILPFFITGYILLLALLSLIPQRKGFVLLICLILVSALSFLLLGFLNGLDSLQQLSYIFNHLFFTVNAVLLYFITYLSKELEEKNRNLQEQISILTSYVENTKLLTEQEFLERMNLILKAMERRKEGGYWIVFSLENIHSHMRSTVYHTLTEKALETFRNDYDLIGQKDNADFMVFLQNTSLVGLNIALNRYVENIHRHLELNIAEIICDVQPVGFKEKKVVCYE